MNDHYNSTFKEHNFLGLGRFEELAIDNCQYKSDTCFDVFDENRPLQINTFTNEIGKGVLFDINSVITILIQPSNTRVLWD